MRIKINLRDWIMNNALAQLVLAPFFYAVYPKGPFEVGMACGVAVMTWLVTFIFWLGKKNGIEIK